MIKSLQDWAMILSGLAVFGSMCEEILPEGSFQKYIRLGLGMLLVLALLSPINDLLHREWDLGEWEARDAYQKTEGMEEREKEVVLRVYQEKLNRKILSVLQEAIPGFSGSVACSVEEEKENFGTIKHLLIRAKEGADVKRIRGILKEQFQLQEKQITVRF